MKKIFRMVFVSVLAGAALLYTGCTKDYSEDISNLESKVAANEGSIASLQSQVAALETAKTALQSAVDAANKEIATLKTALSAVQKTAGDNAEAISKLQKSISDLETTVATCTTKIAAIETELAKKADKTYVDTELAKKADKSWVEENYATASALSKVAADLDAAVLTINNRLDGIDAEIELAKENGAWAKSQIEKAVADITTIFGDIEEIEAALRNIYTKQEVDAIVARLDGDIAKKLDIESYKKDTALVNKHFAAVEQAVVDALNTALANDETIKRDFTARLSALKTAMEAALATKVDKTTFDAFASEMRAAIGTIKADVAAMINRIQSVVNVPTHTDGKITLGFYEYGADWDDEYEYDTRNTEFPAETWKAKWETYAKGHADEATMEEAYQALVDLLDQGYWDPWVPAPSKVTYRIYGVEAESIARGLAAAWKDGIMAFDVVKVTTRAEEEAVAPAPALKIVDVVADGDKLVFTVLSENFDPWFYSYQSDHDIQYLLGQYSQYYPYAQTGYSVSLVISQETETVKAEEEGAEDTTNNVRRFITSEYTNCVSEFVGDIVPVIVAPGADGKDVAVTEREEVEIEYIDLEKHPIFKDYNVKFTVGADEAFYTVEQLAEKNIVIAPVYQGIVTNIDTTSAVKPGNLGADYVSAEPFFIEGTKANYSAKLSKLTPDGVYTKLFAGLNVFVGNNSIAAYSRVTVVPHKDTVSVTLNPAEFVWNYKDDAAVDADRFVNGEQSEALYSREGVVVDFTEAAAKLAEIDVDLAYFARAEAQDFIVTKDGVKLTGDEFENFNVYPIIVKDEETGELSLKANITGFEFNGKVYTVQGTYALPTPQAPSVLITVKTGFTVKDRERDVIVVNLPEKTVDFVVNGAPTVVADSVREADGYIVEPCTLKNHGLTDADMIDAFLGGHEFFAQSDTVRQNVRQWEFQPATSTGANNGFVLPAFEEKMVVNDDVVFIEALKGAKEDTVMVFNTHNAFSIEEIGANQEFEPWRKYEKVITLWYGQKIAVNKTIKFNVEDLFDFEAIEEYVKVEGDESWTNTRGYWNYSGSTSTEVSDASPLASFALADVNLNKHFRVVDLKNDKKATDANFSFTSDYRNILQRVFILDSLTTEHQVWAMRDARYDKRVVYGGREQYLREAFPNFRENSVYGYGPREFFGVSVRDENVIRYNAMTEQVGVYGFLFLVNRNQSKVAVPTRFDGKIAHEGANVDGKNETYANYVVKGYDPIRTWEITDDVPEINVNNSTMRRISILDYIDAKDTRGVTLFDTATHSFVRGNGNNGFANRVYADDVYHIVYDFGYEFDESTPVSDETKGRFSFENGTLIYNNQGDTFLQNELLVNLYVNLYYPWGQKTATKQVKIYEKVIE